MNRFGYYVSLNENIICIVFIHFKIDYASKLETLSLDEIKAAIQYKVWRIEKALG
jgi:hypothetical protein